MLFAAVNNLFYSRADNQPFSHNIPQENELLFTAVNYVELFTGAHSLEVLKQFGHLYFIIRNANFKNI